MTMVMTVDVHEDEGYHDHLHGKKMPSNSTNKKQSHTHTNDCTPQRDCSPLKVKKANGNLTTEESEAVM